MKKFITTILMLPLSITLAMAQQNPLPDFLEVFKQQQWLKPVEKVYLHLDKTEYAQAEMIWMKSYLVAGASHSPSELSKNVYVELLTEKGELVKRLTLKSEEGLAEASMPIPRDQPQGFYYLRAYTNWMKNQPQSYFFNKKIRILSTKEDEVPVKEIITEKVDLQFYPEGGDLIKGVPTKLAFEVTGLDLTKSNIKGQIIDTKGQVVKEFETTHEGRGMIPFVPTGEQYSARLEGYEQEFDVPTVRPYGQVMTVNNSRDDYLTVSIKSATESKEVFYLLAHTRGYVTYASESRLVGARGFIKIDKSTIPSGITHLTLFNKYMEPIAERLAFIDHNDKLNIEVNTNKQQYGSRELATVGIKVTDNEGKPVQGSFSMSVFNSDLAKNDQLSYDIRANLLLGSDLPGHILNPGQYFTDSPEAKANLDLLMMVNGWRRFSWVDIVDQPLSLFPAETGLSIEGKVTRINGNDVKDGKVFLVHNSEDGNGAQFVTTDEEGRFTFTNLDYNDTTFLRFQGFQKGVKKNVLVTLDTSETEPLPLRYPYHTFADQNDPTRFNEYKRYARTAIYVDSTYRRENGITYLGTVTVEADRRDFRSRMENAQFGPGERYFDFQDIPFEQKAGRDPYWVMIGRVPGFNLRQPNQRHQSMGFDYNAFANTPIIDRVPEHADLFTDDPIYRAPQFRQGAFGGTPMVLLDNVPVPWDVIYSLQAVEIDYVEFYNPATSNMFGGRGMNGAMAFFTLKGARYYKQFPERGILYTQLGGYHTAREFYAPRYDTRRRQRYIPDNRSTLYWEPMITTDENGEAMLNFFTPDTASGVIIDVQGLSGKGIAGRGNAGFAIRSNF